MILFATSFRNEISASGGPARVTPVANQATLTQSVSSSGYSVASSLSNASSSLTIDIPVAASNYRYVKRVVKFTPKTTFAGLNVRVFGYSISTEDSSSVLDIDATYDICVVYDQYDNVGKVYVNGRFATTTIVDSNAITVTRGTAAPVSFTAVITDLGILTTDDPEPISLTFRDLELTELSNEWSYTGDSLIESIDKDNVVTTSPNAKAYNNFDKFEVAVEDSQYLLVESAGSISSDKKVGMLVNKRYVPFTSTQGALKSIITSGTSIEVERIRAPLELLVETTSETTVYVDAANVLVSWGDDTETVGSGLVSKTYSPGVYELSVFTDSEIVSIAGAGIVEFTDWGNTDNLKQLSFYNESQDLGCKDLSKVPAELPETIVSTENMFRRGGTVPEVVNWDVSNVTQFESMFRDNVVFDEDLSGWNVAHIEHAPEGFDTGATSWELPRPMWGVYVANWSLATKIANPAVLPAGNGLGAAFSPDSSYLAVAHDSSIFIAIYKRNGDTFTKLANPDVRPTGNGRGVAFSPNNSYLAVAHSNVPNLTIYKRNGDTFTKLANPDVRPAGHGRGVAFSSDGLYLAVAHNDSPFITIYKRNGDLFTKVNDPDVLPPNNCFGVAFSPDGLYLAVAHSGSPFITVYKRNGDTFTKVNDPDVLPTGSGTGASFSPDGLYLAVAHNTSPYLTVYKRNGDTFTKVNDPDVLPSSNGQAAAFSPDGLYLAVAHTSSPFITIYKRNGDTFTKVNDPNVLPTGNGVGAAFSLDNSYLAVAHGNSPRITIYKPGS